VTRKYPKRDEGPIWLPLLLAGSIYIPLLVFAFAKFGVRLELVANALIASGPFWNILIRKYKRTKPRHVETDPASRLYL
jgi:hypothetical protein